MSLRFGLTTLTTVVAAFGATWSAQSIILAGQDVSRIPPFWVMIFGLSSALAAGLVVRYWNRSKKSLAALLLLIFVLSLFLSAWLGVEMGFFWVKKF